MQCPVCQTDLRIVEREGIEIDACPRCRGVWLDRGELEKIVERASLELRRARDRDERDDRRDDRDSRRDDRRDDRDYRREESQPPKKKESFWGNLFDWD